VLFGVIDDALMCVLHTVLFLRARQAVTPVDVECERLRPLTYPRYSSSSSRRSSSSSRRRRRRVINDVVVVDVVVVVVLVGVGVVVDGV
jgi:hypothetical protein